MVDIWGETTGGDGVPAQEAIFFPAAWRRNVASSNASVVGAGGAPGCVTADSTRFRPHEEQYFAPARFGVWQFGQVTSVMEPPVQLVWVLSLIHISEPTRPY